MTNSSSSSPRKCFADLIPVLRRGAAAALVLLGLTACGSDKGLSPISTLRFVKTIPKDTFVTDVDPAQARQTFFEFIVRLNDPELTTIDADSWVLDRQKAVYTITSDPGGHLNFAPYGDTTNPVGVHILRSKLTIKPNTPTRISEMMVPFDYIDGSNGSGADTLIGTTDTARIDVDMYFTFHRVKDGKVKRFHLTYYFTLQDL